MTEIVAKKLKSPVRNRGWWAEQVATCEKSGMTLVAYAKAHGLRLGSLYKWKAVLRREKKTAQKNIKAKPVRFLEVTVDKQRLSDRVEIVSPRGWKVCSAVDVDSDAASRILSLVEDRT